jgi:hypothetical protein
MSGKREAVVKFWAEWAAANLNSPAEGWLELTPEQARKFAADFSLAENAELRKERDEALGLAGATMEELEAAEAEVVKLREEVLQERERIVAIIESYKCSELKNAKDVRPLIRRLIKNIRESALNPGAAKEPA